MALRLRGAAILVSVALPASTLLSACAFGDSTPTCAKYNKMSMSDQTSALEALLRKHKLDPYSQSNLIGLGQDVISYCGPSLGNSDQSTNSNSSIANAVSNWGSKTW